MSESTVEAAAASGKAPADAQARVDTLIRELQHGLVADHPHRDEPAVRHVVKQIVAQAQAILWPEHGIEIAFGEAAPLCELGQHDGLERRVVHKHSQMVPDIRARLWGHQRR